MQKYIVQILVVSLVFLSGCWDIEEAERMDYVHGIGVDYKDGQVVVSLQIVNLGNLGNPESGGSGGGGTHTVIAKAKGETVNDAVFEIYESTQRRLFWGHTTFIVVTEEAMKQNKMKDVLDLMDRYRETRYRILLFTTQDEDVDKLLEAAPIFDGSPVYTRLTDLNNTYEQSSWIQIRSMREFFIQIKEPGYNAIIPSVTTTENEWTSSGKPETLIKTVGVALTNKDKLQGFITGDDLKGFRWLEKEAVRSHLDVNKDGERVAEMVILRPSFSIKPNVKGETVTFHIDVEGKSLLNELVKEESHDFLKKEIEKTIEEEIKHTFNKALELDSDIYRLSEVLYRKNVSAWNKVNKNGKVPLDENSIKVTVNIEIGPGRLDTEAPVIK